MTVRVVAARQSGTLARVKAGDEGAGRVADRLRDVLESAQYGERDFDSRWRLRVSIVPAPAPDDNAWELAAVLADRVARGVFTPSRARLIALGQSSDWILGRIATLTDSCQAERIRTLLAQDLREAQIVTGAGPESDGVTVDAAVAESGVCGDLLMVSHLAGLSGHPDPAGFTRTASAWFPVVAGDSPDSHDRLIRVQVTVRPRADKQAMEEEVVTVAGLREPRELRTECARVLEESRIFDAADGRWMTGIRFERAFSDNSYELALVMADRMARGREVSPRGSGRIIATGRSQHWVRGIVEPVEGVAAKCALIAREIRAGDRVLLPSAWRSVLPKRFMETVQRASASCATIDRIA